MDLLAYYQSGSLKTLNQLCQKVLGFLSWDGHENDKKTLLSVLKKRLQDFGLIELTTVAGENTWCSLEPGFIEINKGEYLLVGPLLFREQVLTQCQSLSSPVGLSNHLLYAFPNKFGFKHSLTITKIDAPQNVIHKMASSLQARTYLQAERSFDLLLTPLTLLCDQLTVDEYFTGITDYTEFEQFDFCDCGWKTVEGPSITAQGYYRLPYQFGAARHVCLTQVHGSKRMYDITANDWGYFIALQLLNKKSLWQYRIEQKQLWVPSAHFALLPNLFKRALICQAFKWPQIEQNHYVLMDISTNDVEFILQKYPVLRIKYEF